MTDLLIRDVPESVIVAIDARARRLGLSRSEYLRRVLGRERHAEGVVTVSDLAAFTARFGGLSDDDLMAQAWQ